MNIFPKKSLGQNFLLDKKVIKEIVDIGNISKNSTVIEIGPGTGSLTEEILKKKPKKFIAIEKDHELYLKLKKKFSSEVEFINQDVLQINWDNYFYENCLIFGNLPYNISAKILIDWIRLNNLNKQFKKLILMFQKEVADRIIADVNSSKYGRLTILTNWKLNVKKIMDIDPKKFFPKPKVQSSLIYLEPKNNFFHFQNSKNLEKVTDIFFQNKRKMIKKPLNILFKNSSKIVNKLNLDDNFRPQNIDPITFFKISKEYEDENSLN
tara:strand:+ start:651 stop:1448 length:798 start_codon:yes stop_codon:yes gene_type:complete